MASVRSDLPGKVSQGCLVGATFAYIVAFSSSAWMKYVNPAPGIEAYVPRYGLWETCSCRQVYTLFVATGTGSDSAEDFPGWLTASQLFVTFAMVTLFSAFVLACYNLYGSYGNKSSHIALLCMVAGTALFLLLTLVLFRARFPRERYFKRQKEIVAVEDKDDVDIRPDWGMGCAVLSLIFTTIAGTLVLVQLVKMRRPGDASANPS